MKREILFRGKRVYNDEWVYGFLLATRFTEDNKSYIWDLGERVGVYPETVGQYTGLNDKNDVKIFEGDKVIVLSGETAVVVFRNGAFMLEWVGFDSYADLLGWIDFKKCIEYDEASFEVIGNIYENPELLTATTNPSGKEE
jgi:uncharacterized phage protein (TIGR01671 family)